MKNLTISLEDDIYRKARIVAAEQGTSLSSIVREYLQGLSNSETDRERERQERNQLMDELFERTAHFRLGEAPSREERNARG